jgi:type II secretory pathway pseudopilin PulG
MSFRSKPSRESTGFALAEPLMALAVLGLVAASSIYTLFSANRYTATQRVVSAAKAFCQERIDQALTDSLTTSNVGAVFGGAWPLPAAETLVSAETVPLYVTEANTNTALVSGTRKTWVTSFTPDATNPAFVFARVRVRVEFWDHGRGVGNKKSTDVGAQPLFYEMTTLRSPD